MAPQILKQLMQAIQERRVAVIRYGDQHRIRVVEPHVIYGNREGAVIVECYQTGGHVQDERPLPSWKLFRLMKIRSAALLNTTFETRLAAGFDPRRQEYLKGLIAMVDAPAPRAPEPGPFLSTDHRRWLREMEQKLN